MRPGWAFTGFALLLWVLIRRDYGITWDEPVQSLYGEAVRTVLSGARSLADLSHVPGLPPDIFNYGPAFDLCCATLAHFLNADVFTVRHALQGLLWVSMFYPACALGQRIAGRTAAWCVGCALLGTPTMLGHAFNNPKDLPLACATIWMLHLAVTAASARGLTWHHALRLGVGGGGVLAARPGAWFLCAPLALVPLVHAARARGPDRPQRGRNARANTWPALCAAVVIAWVLMVVPWPSAWHSPLGFPVKAAFFAMHFPGDYSVLFGGTSFPSNQLPWNYLAGYLVVTVPVPLLALAVWGHRAMWQRASRAIPAMVAGAGIAFLLWLPMVMFVVARPNVYDGMRHFLFMLPPLAVCAGVGGADIMRRLRSLPRPIVVWGTVTLLASAIPMMMRLHPYENVYYNFLAGPRSTLSERYETDYWLSSYREAALWINEVQSHRPSPLTVAVAAADPGHEAFTHYLDPRIQVAVVSFADLSADAWPPAFDYYVGTVRYDQWENYSSAPIAHRIESDGALLAVIRERPPAASR